MLVLHVSKQLSDGTLPDCYMTVRKSPKLVCQKDKEESIDVVRNFIPQYRGICYESCEENLFKECQVGMGIYS